jgi:hypothetical protein
MKSRTRSRKAASIGSNQSLKSDTASSTSGCTASRFVVGLVMAWSPARRANAGFDWVRQSGDYAIRNSNQHRDSTRLGPQALWIVTNGEEELRRGAMADRVPRKERGCQLVDDGDDHGVEFGDLVVRFLASATIVVFLRRPPLCRTRSWNQPLSAEPGWCRSHSHASSTIMARNLGLPAFDTPCSCLTEPLCQGVGAKPA